MRIRYLAFRWDAEAATTHATEALELLTLKSLRDAWPPRSRAAARHATVERGLAQSAASRAIAELERALGGAFLPSYGTRASSSTGTGRADAAAPFRLCCPRPRR